MTMQWAVLTYMALFPEVQSFEVTTLFQILKALNKYQMASFSV